MASVAASPHGDGGVHEDDPIDRISRRRADIQGLRGLAVLLVVAFHAGIAVPGGFIGVDVFFVISGFVITNLLFAELETTSRLRFRAFYVRRVRRLLPALALVIVAVMVLGIFLLSPLGTQQHTASLGRSAATFRANLSLYNQSAGYFDLSPSTNPFLHMWSLAVEEQFYLVFPVFVLLAWSRGTRLLRLRSRRVATAAWLAIAAGASLWLSADLTSGHSLQGTIARPALFAFYSLPTRAWEFAFGALLALGVPVLQRLPRGAGVIGGSAGLLLIIISARLITATTPFPGTVALVPVIGATLLIAAGTVTSSGVGRLLETKVLVWLGDLSYSWYLWHWPLIVFAAAMWPLHGSLLLPLVAALALGPSWLSYRFFERPFRTRASWTRHRALAIAAICIATPVAASFALAPRMSRFVASTASVDAMNYQLRPHSRFGSRCSGTVQDQPKPACTAAPTAPTHGEVWLVGDSQAGQLAEPVAQATSRNRFTFITSHFDQCPFVDLLLVTQHIEARTCRHFVRATVDNLIARSPRLVIIASDSSSYIDDGAFTLQDPRTHVTASTRASKARLWELGLRAVLQRFHDANIPALVVNTIPHFGSWDPRTCPALILASGIGRCGTSRSASSVRSEQAAALEAERRATRATTTDMIDFTDLLCDHTRCATNRGAAFVYLDSHHLSVDGALTLAQDFSRRIVAGARSS